MRRAQLIRATIRRHPFSSGGGSGVTSISFNGGPAQTGAIAINSPMLATTTSPIEIENGNPKTLTDAASVVGIDSDLNNVFKLTATANRTISQPTNKTTQRKITFVLINGSGVTGQTHTFATGAAGDYLFANAAVGSAGAVTLAQYQALAALVPAGNAIEIGFEYNTDLDRWLCVALAGWF